MRLPFDGISSWWILGVFEVAMMPQWHQEHLHLPYHACSWHRSFPPHPATAQHRAVVCVRSCSSLSVAVVRLGQRHSKMVCLRFYLLQPKAHRLSGLLEPPCLNPTQDAGHLWEVVALPPIWGGQLVACLAHPSCWASPFGSEYRLSPSQCLSHCKYDWKETWLDVSCNCSEPIWNIEVLRYITGMMCQFKYNLEIPLAMQCNVQFLQSRSQVWAARLASGLGAGACWHCSPLLKKLGGDIMVKRNRWEISCPRKLKPKHGRLTSVRYRFIRIHLECILPRWSIEIVWIEYITWI